MLAVAYLAPYFFFQTDDKLALREIAVQLNLENVVSGTQKVFGSFAQVPLLTNFPFPIVIMQLNLK